MPIRQQAGLRGPNRPPFLNDWWELQRDSLEFGTNPRQPVNEFSGILHDSLAAPARFPGAEDEFPTAAEQFRLGPLEPRTSSCRGGQILNELWTPGAHRPKAKRCRLSRSSGER